MIEPYYQRGGITIYHGGAGELLPQLPGYNVFDPLRVLLTDPPYGVNLGAREASGRRGRGKRELVRSGYSGYSDTPENFRSVVGPIIRTLLRDCGRGAVFMGPRFGDLPEPDVLAGVYCSAGSGRTAWGFKTFLPLFLYGTSPRAGKGASVPLTLQSNDRAPKSAHPCPKPLSWMRWAVDLVAAEGDVIVDPFCGSGTTLRAAKDRGHEAIGIELSEEYCELSATYLEQEVFPW